MRRFLVVCIVVAAVVLSSLPAAAAPPSKPSGSMIGINVVLNTGITRQILADLGTRGKVRDVIYELNALTMQIASSTLPSIQALPYVASASPDAERNGAPVDAIEVSDFCDERSAWNLDAINVTAGPGFNHRAVDYDGNGVYVAVLDTGLLDSWRQYFPEERIATEYARAFAGGGGDMGAVSSQPNKWEHDQNSHGTHVTSTILGYSFPGSYFDGVAPMATVIPVKVLNQNGHGWSSVIARGIVYVADLKADELSGSPVVINMSLGGRSLDPLEEAAINYAIGEGVIIVASAGNSGTAGMGYPGGYAPVISVAASGWIYEWYWGTWWWAYNVADATDPAHFYIADFSSRQKAGQDLDIAAPGSWVVGPYQDNSGQLSWAYLGGTSMASPHVAGTVALMAEKYPALTAAQAETLLEGSAVPIGAGSRTISDGYGGWLTISWGTDATGAGLLDAAAAIAATP